MRNLFLGAFFLSLAGAIWGGMFLVVRVSVVVIPPVPLVWCRYGTALIVLLAVMLWRRESFFIDRKDRRLLFLSALIGQTISIVTQETGTMLTSAQTGSVITAAAPAFMVLFGCWLLQEKFTRGRAASVVLATVGVLFIVFDPDNVQVTPLGGLSLLIVALTWALMSVILKLLSRYSVVTLTFYGTLIAFVLLTPYGLYWGATQADYAAIGTPAILGSVFYLGFISTAAGFMLWNKGLLYMDASIAGLFMFWQPIVGTFLGWYFLDEPITATFWLGFALIAGGVALALRGGNTTAEEKLQRSRRQEKTGRTG